MKLKKDFILRRVADTWVVLPLGQEAERFAGMLTLNASGAMLWEVLEKTADPETLVKALMAEYEVEEDRAREDVESFLKTLEQAGCLET